MIVHRLLLLQSAPGKHHASGNYQYLRSKNIPLDGAGNAKVRDLPINKGQVARIIAAFKGVDLSEGQAIQFMYMNDLATGATGKNDYKDYGAKNSISRAEAAVFFDRLSRQGNCKISGLSKAASGRDNSKYELPLNFLGDETVNFPTTNDKPQLGDSRVANIDIENGTLIANGVDSTFITVSLRSCSGSPISYEDSLSFSVTSELGAKIDNGNFGSSVIASNISLNAAIKAVESAEAKAAQASRNVEYAELRLKNATWELNYDYLYKLLEEARWALSVANTEVNFALAHLDKVRTGVDSNQHVLYRTSSTAYTDGPDLTVKITAPQSSVSKTDKISFQVTGQNQSNTECYVKPITVQLNYAPQAELRLEYQQQQSGLNLRNGENRPSRR